MPDLRQLGRYQLQASLGSGAYADVYRAIDTALDRQVAIKVLKPALIADEETFQRFMHEARVLANLIHPHIAWVWDVGQEEDRYFIVIRYIDGISLDKLLAERGPLSWEEASSLIRQAAEALAFAHQKGFVHRDVKPQNLLVSPADGVVLTDFGLVKSAGSSGAQTRSNALIGTPQYIPPEIWRGAQASPASDQYALACVLVEMLSGKALFDAPTLPAIMHRHFEPPQMPASWPLGTPSELESGLRKALSRLPHDRYAGVMEFVEALTPSRPSDEVRHFYVPELRGERKIDKQHDSDELCLELAPGVMMEFVRIPGGEFLYGEDNQKKYNHKPYLIGKYPVTQAQYQSFINANPSHSIPFLDADFCMPFNWDKKTRTHPKGKEKHPVALVSWQDAQDFCRWVSQVAGVEVRLPTEQEWEKAARSTDGRTYPWGEEWTDGKYANSYESGIGGTIPVDEFPLGISPYGAWDMSGNLWEWTSSPHEDGGYTLRGGSWNDDAYSLHSYYRYHSGPSNSSYCFGFRCARSC